MAFGRLMKEEFKHIYHQQCIPHRIHLSVQDSVTPLDEIRPHTTESMLHRMQSVVTKFKQSDMMFGLLKVAQAKRGIKVGRLKGYVKTRFTSLYGMISSLHDNRLAILEVWMDPPILGDEWKALPYILYSLKPFVKVFTYLGGENYPTINKAVACALILLSHPEPAPIGIDTLVPPIALDYHKNLINQAKKLGSLETHELMAFASDPCQSYLPFLKPDHKEIIRANFRAYLNQERKKVVAPVVIKPTGDMIDDLIQIQASWNPDECLQTAYELFAGRQPLQPNGDKNIAINFWSKVREGDELWPLRDICLRLLTIPGSSSPCERLFSTTGMTDDHNQLAGSRGNELLLFLHQNRDYLLSIPIEQLILPRNLIDENDDTDADSSDDINSTN
jgi:hypothetical protein